MTRLKDWVFQEKRYQVYQLKGDAPHTYLVRGPRGRQWKMVPTLEKTWSEDELVRAYVAVSLAPDKPWHDTPVRYSHVAAAEFAVPIGEVQ